VALHALPSLRSDSRIREIDTDDAQNKYGYLYNVYYPEDPSKPPVGVVYHKEKFYQFYHSTTTGNPYLGDQYKEANHFELPEDDSSTETGGDEQLTLQIHNSVVALNPGDLGSPERTREAWAPSSTPTITPTTYTAQQEQSRLPMATVTLQAWRTVRRGRVGVYQGNDEGPRVLDSCRGQRPATRHWATLGQAHTRAWSL
jgi:hypothetical protein